MEYHYYTDGAATMKNVNDEYIRGPGGWAFICCGAFELRHDWENQIEYGREDETTNNRMELMAIYKALIHFTKACDENSKISQVKIYSDSAYCINIFTLWINGWESNGWTRGKKKEPIENCELIQQIWKLIKELESRFKTVKFEKVKGHSDNHLNNLVDQYAVMAKENKI